MHWSSRHRIDREELAYCFPFVVRLSYHKCKSSCILCLLILKVCAGSPKFATGGTYPVLRSSVLQHWFKNWQELRQQALFPRAIGFWRHRRVQLWLEKIGAIETFSGNLSTCWSNIKEEEALERYKLITGNTVLFPEFQVYGNTNENPGDNWLGASPDGIVDRLVSELPSRGVLEIKCPFFNGDMANASPWSRIPLYCVPEAQGLMEIIDRDWMDFYVWTPKGSCLFRLYRDHEYWNVLKTAPPIYGGSMSSLQRSCVVNHGSSC
ncbi:hypothetical protein FNV43_RR23734 [Rhamnella rubrinervis]|uniref:YqaJ viral recombinase domain-containing protein n=1 Tax=Rhamnella rubrinervis TaxID=2594499 RepID=A0A8K0DK80_9ROSA|nr:hypothetical protein FNV43_RR23734 [Rhamnella rubrinervis]